MLMWWVSAQRRVKLPLSWVRHHIAHVCHHITFTESVVCGARILCGDLKRYSPWPVVGQKQTTTLRNLQKIMLEKKAELCACSFFLFCFFCRTWRTRWKQLWGSQKKESMSYWLFHFSRTTQTIHCIIFLKNYVRPNKSFWYAKMDSEAFGQGQAAVALKSAGLSTCLVRLGQKYLIVLQTSGSMISVFRSDDMTPQTALQMLLE